MLSTSIINWKWMRQHIHTPSVIILTGKTWNPWQCHKPKTSPESDPQSRWVCKKKKKKKEREMIYNSCKNLSWSTNENRLYTESTEQNEMDLKFYQSLKSPYFTYQAKPLSNQGFWPEWYISTIYHCKDIPFRSETLEIIHQKLSKDKTEWWEWFLMPVRAFSFHKQNRV